MAIQGLPEPSTELPSTAWIAGFFDGEGHVGTMQPRLASVDCRARILRVSVSQCDPQPLVDIRTLFGGSIVRRPVAKNGNRPVHVWTAKARLAEQFLRAIQPYVRVKAKQVRLALELRDSINNRPNTSGLPEPIDRFVKINDIALAISALNGRQNKNVMKSASWEVR